MKVDNSQFRNQLAGVAVEEIDFPLLSKVLVDHVQELGVEIEVEILPRRDGDTQSDEPEAGVFMKLETADADE